MTSWTGILPTLPTTPSQMSVGPQYTRLATPTLMPQYKMQGYYTTGSTWETWTSFVGPNNTPPSGHSLINITYIVLTPVQTRN